MSNIKTSWISKLSHNERVSGRIYGLHASGTCREESGKISRRWLLILFVVISGAVLLSNQIINKSKEFPGRTSSDKHLNYIISVDNSSKSAKYLDQAKSQIERIIKEIPDGDSPVTLITLDAPSSPVKGKANIAVFLQGMKPAGIATDFKLLFGAVREQVAKEGRNNVYLISNGKYDPSGSMYLEGLQKADSQAQSLVLAKEIRDDIRLPDNCIVKSLSIGDNPDEIILQAIAGINAKQGN